MKMRFFCFLCVLFVISCGYAKDDILVRGKVLESTGFHHPIPHAVIKVMKADSTFVAASVADECTYESYRSETDNTGKKYTGGFSIYLPRKDGKYILSVSSMGYSSTTVDIDLSKLGKRESVLRLDPIYLSPAPINLDEVVVRASKVKFHYKGDTLVYTADAFKLAEGSMLDALVQQLPNVELKDNGSIYVDGKYVEELLLNGKQFFNNNKQLMLQNLAAYTVRDIEVYDKRGMAGELANADLGDNRLVMDVKLKKEYMVGTVLNMEGGYGSNERYLGRLFGMAFTPIAQYAVYFNVNNLNDSRKPGQQSTWAPEKMPTGVRKTVTGGFDYNIKTLNQKWELNGNVNAESTHETDGTDVLRTNFLTGGDTYDYQFRRSKSESLSLATRHKISYKTSKGYGIATEPYFAYHKWNNYGENTEATLDKEFNHVTTDFIQSIYDGDAGATLSSLINRYLSMERQKGHSVFTGTYLWQGFKLPGTSDMMVVNLYGKYNNRHDERFNHYELNIGKDPTPTQKADRYFKNYPDFNSNLGAEVSWSHGLARGMMLTLLYRYDHNYRKETSGLYLLDSPESVEDFMFGKLPSALNYESALDRNNSYLRRETEDNHRMALRYSYSNGILYIQYNLPVTLARQKLDYQRGVVDTTFTRRSLLFDIGNALFKWDVNKRHQISLSWDLKSQAPDLVTMVDFTDDTDPLYIRKGNRHLKNALQFGSRLSYRYDNREKGSRIFLEGRYAILSNALSQGYTYDRTTGIRQSSYYNVNGNWSTSGSIGYMKQFGRGLMIGNRFGVGHVTNVDLVGENSPRLTRSKVYNLSFSDELRMEYRFGKHQLGLNVTGEHNRFTSNRTDFATQNTWTVKSGLNAIFELPANFQLATDMTVYTRRGYTDKLLNTDNYVWNPRLTYRALKGKLLLSLDGYDILHDLSNVSYSMNAQGRTETYRTVLPRYFMFHLQWRFNHSPKSKK